jgi:hypothetical protein
MHNILTFLLLDGINQFPMCFMWQKSAPEKEDSSREAEEFHLILCYGCSGEQSKSVVCG